MTRIASVCTSGFIITLQNHEILVQFYTKRLHRLYNQIVILRTDEISPLSQARSQNPLNVLWKKWEPLQYCLHVYSMFVEQLNNTGRVRIYGADGRALVDVTARFNLVDVTWFNNVEPRSSCLQRLPASRLRNRDTKTSRASTHQQQNWWATSHYTTYLERPMRTVPLKIVTYPICTTQSWFVIMLGVTHCLFSHDHTLLA